MKPHIAFQNSLGISEPDDIFQHLMKTLKRRLVTPSYLVNWNKVITSTKHVEIALHQLDYILGKPDIEQALFDVIKQQPHVVDALPAVLASRDRAFVLIPTQGSKYLEIEHYFFGESRIQNDDDIAKIVKFCKTVGLLDFLQQAAVTSFIDFVYGVETGLDSNGRKNRGGNQMESIVEHLISAICDERGYRYISQATSAKILDAFGKSITLGKTNRAIDFVIDNSSKLVFIETNFYGTSGSKLKATAGEYRVLQSKISEYPDCEFIWVTDGQGWMSARAALNESFNVIDYIINLEMIAQGVLEGILTS